MIYISLGSNLGNRLNYLRQAVELLKKRYLTNVKCSVVLETNSILPDNAPRKWDKPFLNMVVRGDCDIAPEVLLNGLKQIEYDIGRPLVYERWAPRVIDLDILLFNDLTINTPNLKIPHIELNNRPFLRHLINLLNNEYNSNVIENDYLNSYTIFPSLVGIVNITPDSFSDGGLYNDIDDAIEQVRKLALQGASIIELGAQSTRTGALIQKPEQEYKKLRHVLDGLSDIISGGNMTISIDTFWPEVIHKILKNYPIAWINDVSGNLDNKSLEFICQRKCSLVMMHSLTVPPQKDIIIPDNISPTKFITQWAKERIQKLISIGFSYDSIIIDPGIGFGKSIYQNISLLRNIEELQQLGCKILIGHSRKSFMTAFTKSDAKNRDIETIAVSAFLQNKVDYIRVHNIAEHMRFFVAQKFFETS